MTIAQIKEVYENIFNICKKYDDSKNHYISEDHEYEYDYTISIDGSSYNFNTNIVFHAFNNDPNICYLQWDINIEMSFNDNGINVNYSIESKEHLYTNDEIDNIIKTEVKDLELTTKLVDKDRISDAEIPEFKNVLKKINKRLSFYFEDFEFTKLIFELNDYIKSV